MARVLDEDELIGNWTLVGDELEQLSGRRGATELGVRPAAAVLRGARQVPDGPQRGPSTRPWPMSRD